MASTDTYIVHTLFTEWGYDGGSYEMTVYARMSDEVREAYHMAADAKGERVVCDHCDEVVYDGDSTFQPFVAETDSASAGYVACLPCYVQGVYSGGVEMAIVNTRTAQAALVQHTGKHAAA